MAQCLIHNDFYHSCNLSNAPDPSCWKGADTLEEETLCFIRRALHGVGKRRRYDLLLIPKLL